MNRKTLLWTRRGVTVISVVVFIWMLTSGFEHAVRLPPGTAVRLLVAVPVSLLGLVCAALSWSTLVGISWQQGVAAFGTSLPLRHLPLGGVGQVAGLAGMSVTNGASARRATQAGPAFLLVTASGAAIVATPVAWDTQSPWLIRLCVVLTASGSLLLILAGKPVLRTLAKWWKLAEGSENLPIASSVVWSALAAVGAGIAFAILFPEGGSWIESISGFSVAWLGGFLFVIAPAGLGAREAVLAALWPSIDSAEVVAAALLHRLSTLGGEGLILLLGLIVSRSVNRASLERM
jgi:hypothetical protein